MEAFADTIRVLRGLSEWFGQLERKQTFMGGVTNREKNNIQGEEKHGT